MFVVVNPNEGKVYGSFATWGEARIWGEDRLPAWHGWRVNELTLAASNCAIPQVAPSDSEGDCC